jgi:hypothetical protein
MIDPDHRVRFFSLGPPTRVSSPAAGPKRGAPVSPGRADGGRAEREDSARWDLFRRSFLVRGVLFGGVL